MSLQISDALAKKGRDTALGSVLHAILRREGRLDLHSAAVSRNGHEGSLLIIGPKGVGKSSLTVTLARSGWSFLSDDSVLVWSVDGSLRAGVMRLPIYLTPDALARLPQGQPDGVFVRSLGKSRFFPDELFPGQHRRQASVDALVFPKLGSGPSILERLGASDAFQRLLVLCPFLATDPTAKPCLDVAKSLVSRPAYLLHAGPDLLDPATASKILESV